MRLLRIFTLGLVLWLLCGAAPQHAVACRVVCDAELSEANGYADQLRCERLYNSDFNLTRAFAEVMPQITLRNVVRGVDFVARPGLRTGDVCGSNHGTVCAAGTFGSEGMLVCGPAVDYYVYRLRRLII